MNTSNAPFCARRADRLGVHSLDHVQFSVPEPGQASQFFTAFGLAVSESPAGLEVRAHGDDHVWLRIGQSDSKRLDRVVFGAFAEDLNGIAARLAGMNVAFVRSHTEAGAERLCFADPNGMAIEVRVADKVMPDAKTLPVTRSCPAGERGAVMRGETPPVHPARMAHALFFTPDIETSVAFCQEALGLRISDFPGPVAFMHGAHGSDHHLIAFAQSEAGIGYHHSAWDVSSLDEVGLGAGQMAAAGFDKGWGLGRHVLGSNYFFYVRDPWGSYAEYSFDIDFIPASMDWPAGYPAPENSLYLWGPAVPEDFVTNFERHDQALGDAA